MTRSLRFIVLPLDGGEPVSREMHVPEYVSPSAALERTLSAIRDMWGEEEVHEVIDRHAGALP